MSLFSKRLKELREEHGLSLRELAEKCGLSKSAVHLYELGTRNPKREALEEFACFFNVDMDYLLGKTDVKNSAAHLLGYNSLAEAFAAGIDVDAKLKTLPTELTAGERAWIELYRKLSPDTRATMVTLVEKFEDLPDGERQMLLGVIRGALSNRGE